MDIALPPKIPYSSCMSESIQKSCRWWELRFSCSDPDELAAMLISSGAAGAHLSDAHHITCYLQSDSQTKDIFCAEALRLGGVLVSALIVKEENWNDSCPELWEHRKIGNIEIIPVKTDCTATTATSLASHQIKIVPGMGFGTGHHPTTAMVLELIQSEHLVVLEPKEALDVGTGSGILAIAASVMYGAQVTAIDIDAQALENAKTNSELNNCQHQIAFSTTPAAALTGKFNLIMANIYAEVLQSLRPDFERLLAPHGILIVSGIMLPLASNLQQDFKDHGWNVEKRLDDSGWVGLLLTR